MLNSISFSLLLPITTILFSVPLLGEFRESIFPATYVGILVVITGFTMWRYFQAQHDALLAELAARESAAAKDLTRTRAMSHQPASRSALWESVDSFVALPTTNDGRLGPASRPSRSRRTHLPIASDIIQSLKGELFSTFVQITRLPLLSITLNTLAWVVHNSHGLTVQTC